MTYYCVWWWGFSGGGGRLPVFGKIRECDNSAILQGIQEWIECEENSRQRPRIARKIAQIVQLLILIATGVA